MFKWTSYQENGIIICEQKLGNDLLYISNKNVDLPLSDTTRHNDQQDSNDALVF